jgi:uncharacterized protein (TIGR03435 family)
MHRETKELPIYQLTVAKGGLKLHPLKRDHPFYHSLLGLGSGDRFLGRLSEMGLSVKLTAWRHNSVCGNSRNLPAASRAEMVGRIRS